MGSAKSRCVSWCLLPKFTRYSLTLLLSAVLLSDAVGATPRNRGLQIAQQSGTTLQDAKRAFARGKQLLNEADKLSREGTAESRRQAIAKYEEALKIWRDMGRFGLDTRHWEGLTLNQIGQQYFRLDDNQKALEYYNQALGITREVKDSFGEARTLQSIAEVYSRLGDKQKALSYFNQALSLFRNLNDLDFEADTLLKIGDIYFELSETKKGFDFYNQALLIRRSQKNLDGQADILKKIGLSYVGLSQPQKALESLNQALDIARTTKNLKTQADILHTIGSVYSSSEYHKALDFYNQALKLKQQAQESLSGVDIAFNIKSQAITLESIASLHSIFLMGEPQKALNYYNQALLLRQKIRDKTGEALVLNYISYIYQQLGQTQKALDVLNQALMLQRATLDPKNEAYTLNNIAGIYTSFGDYQQALKFYNQALDLYRQIQARSQQADTLNNIADIYSLLGDYKLSIETHNQALDIFKSITNRGQEARTLIAIGNIHRITENYPQALVYLNQARQLQHEQEDILAESTTLAIIIRVHESLKDYPKALDTANEMLLLSRRRTNSFNEASALALLGRIYQASGDYQKALSFSQQAMTAMQKLGNRDSQARIIGNIAKAYNSLNQPQQALESYNQELVLWRTLVNTQEEAETLYDIALTERDRSNLNAALTQIEATIKIVENTRSKITDKELRISYFAKVQKYYKFYIDLLMQLHKKDPSKGYDALALEVSDRSRARGLIELLTEANIDIKKGINPQLLAEERRLQWRISAIEKLLSELSSKKDTPEQLLTDTKQKIEDLLKQQRELQLKIRANNPEYADLKYPQPLTIKKIQQQLDKDTLLLQYSLGEKRSYLWAVTPDSLYSYELPGREQIDKAAKNLYNKFLINPGMEGVSPEETGKAANELSKLILAPVANKLGQKRLVIVGDEALQYIPFAALTTSTKSKDGSDYQPLIVNHEIISLPSASTIAIIRKQTKGRTKAPKSLAILADPVFSASDRRFTGKSSSTANNNIDLQLQESALKRSTRNINRSEILRLEGTQQQAQEILKLVSPSQNIQAFGFDANYNWATNKQLSQYKLLHFATHGFLDSTEPELSGIVLSLIDKQGKSQRGFLRLTDIFNLNFPAELVVLSACETGLGEEVKGEGLVGLTRGLMYAGSARVVVSLWKVNLPSTSKLMIEFYKEILEQGKTPAAAMRAAQLKMWQQEDWRNPYSWAGFILQGEWN